MDVSDRRMQVQLTPEAKIASDFFFIGAIFAVVGFVSALKGRRVCGGPFWRLFEKALSFIFVDFAGAGLDNIGKSRLT